MSLLWGAEELTVSSDLAENNLSFMETSALDASNVESAFQTILTGKTSLNVVSISGVTYRARSRRHLPYCVEQVTGAVR